MNQPSQFDLSGLSLLHSPDCSLDAWAQAMLFITNNSMYLWLGLALVLALWRGPKQYYSVFLAVGAFLVAWLINDEFLKPFFARPRPFVTLPELCVLGHLPSSLSFPSGHTITAFAIGTMLSICHRRDLWVVLLCLSFAVLCGYIRVFIGVHYPTDVLAGALLGGVIAVGWHQTSEWARQRYQA